MTRKMPAPTSPRITRRRLLVQAAALLPFYGCVVSPHWAVEAATVRGWVQSLFRDGRVAASLGRLYLHRWPQEASASWLADVLFERDLSHETDPAVEDCLRQRVQDACARDFCADHLVTLDGWVVTRTEARLLALLSLCTDE